MSDTVMTCHLFRPAHAPHMASAVAHGFSCGPLADAGSSGLYLKLVAVQVGKSDHIDKHLHLESEQVRLAA